MRVPRRRSFNLRRPQYAVRSTRGRVRSETWCACDGSGNFCQMLAVHQQSAYREWRKMMPQTLRAAESLREAQQQDRANGPALVLIHYPSTHTHTHNPHTPMTLTHIYSSSGRDQKTPRCSQRRFIAKASKKTRPAPPCVWSKSSQCTACACCNAQARPLHAAFRHPLWPVGVSTMSG